MSYIWQYIRRYKKTLALALLLAAINQIFSLLDPQIFRLMIDRYASQVSTLTASDFLRGIVGLILASVGVSLVSRVAKNFQDYYVNVILNRVGAKMYADSVAHSLSLPFRVFEDQKSGEILRRLQKARDDSQNLIKGLINTVFLSLIGVLFVLIYAFWVNWLIGTLFLVLIPLVAGSIYFISQRIRLIQKEITRQQIELAGFTTETLRNVELIKSMGLKEQEINRLNNTNQRILELELQKVRQLRTLGFFQGTLINTARAIINGTMLWLIFQGTISLGQFFSIIFYSFFVFGPLGDLADVATSYQETEASVAELNKILAIPVEKTPEQPLTLEKLDSIRFDDVSFAYETEQPVLRHINLEIKKGSSVAFVGPSGSGKSTLIKLLVGLYPVSAGQILFNGQDIKNINLESLKRRIGIVTQESQVFAGTIRENLLFANPAASDEDCRRALQNAAANYLLERNEQGLDTLIGEGGLKLSGGERQRLTIARALIRDPEIIIFDEATSDLDSLTEKEIIKTIQDIAITHPDLIVIMIAHRLSTVAHADKICVLQKGQIVECNRHEALLEHGGLYASLWRWQT
jgi:ATP-binding cassette, subfamily B, bacterial